MGSESYAAAGLRSSNVIDARWVFENKRLEVGDLPIRYESLQLSTLHMQQTCKAS